PELAISAKPTRSFIETAMREHGTSGRTFKSALIWAVADGSGALSGEARKVLAWEEIKDEQTELRLDEIQLRQLSESLQKAQRDIRETVWRSYKNIVILGVD